MVVMLGVEVHKDTHTAVAADEVGRGRGERAVRATDAGHRRLLAWARGQFPEGRTWAVEDCRHVSTRLERALLGAGERVLRVPPKLMAGARDSARTRGKSDSIDALAIARAALPEPNLPVAEHDETSRELKLLVDHREDLVAERTRIQNRLRRHLHELDPELDPPARTLGQLGQLDRLAAWLRAQPSGLVARLASELVADVRVLSARVNALEREITQRTRWVAPQVAGPARNRGLDPRENRRRDGEHHPVPLRGLLCHARRCRTDPRFFGRTNRHRPARGGNRQLNAAPHRIAVTQIGRPDSPGQVYYQRRRAQGDNKMEALRALKRRLARVVYNLLQPQETSATGDLPAAA